MVPDIIVSSRLLLNERCVQPDLRPLVSMFEYSPVLENLTLQLRKICQVIFPSRYLALPNLYIYLNLILTQFALVNTCMMPFLFYKLDVGLVYYADPSQHQARQARRPHASSSSAAAVPNRSPSEQMTVREALSCALDEMSGNASVFLMGEETVQRTALIGDVEGDDADEQVGVCKALPEPFQLFQSHKARKPRNQDANGAEPFAIERTRAAIRDL
ncbi:uncharacterized protein [Triticum aestivum]|uniref:uncharacterized protein n=1 Tax=Triticum aestivum TaxID=4565 RepID=UPI001D014C46|nr:uncharacterized protein LOC123110670 [Triticum aestivum]XP_044387192.1 uncharacterized protein LOC123110670 [Triticum aestivum]